MIFVYRAALAAYNGLVRLAAPFKSKAKLLAEGRQQTWNVLQAAFPPTTDARPVAWFHCASLGEFEQGRPLIEAFRQQFPHYRVLLTFFSPSGYEVRKNYEQADAVCYLPPDSAANARRLLNCVRPSVVFFVKYEFWHYYLHEIARRNIPLIGVSAIFRPEQLFFKPWGGFYRQMLHCFTHIFVQDSASLALLRQVGMERATLGGDTRADRVLAVLQQAARFPLVEQFAQGAPVLVIGSSWPDDLQAIGPVLRRFSAPLKVIVAPHEIGEENISHTLAAFEGRRTLRYTQLAPQADNPQLAKELAAAEVLVIDTVGMLSALYRYGQWAYVGGAFGDGLHNVLEAAVYGLPVFFGNRNYRKFQEALLLMQAGAAFAIANGQDFENELKKLYTQPERQQAARQAAARYVENAAGATQRIMHYCARLLA